MKVQLASIAIVLSLGIGTAAGRAQTADQDRKGAASEAKADRKADKAQAKADKDERKALKSSKVKHAARSQDKADAAASSAASK